MAPNNNSIISKYIRAALHSVSELAGADDETLAAYLATKSLKEISAIAGVGSKSLVSYAIASDRADELFDLMDSGVSLGMSQTDKRQVEVLYYYDKLKDQFASETFNDEQNLLHLAQLYNLRRIMTNEVRDARGSDSDRSRIVRELASVDSSITTLEKHLEIDPAKRGERTAQEETADLVAGFVDTATDYMIDEGAPHMTDHGLAGFTMWYFKTPEFMPYCARCGSHDLEFVSPWDNAKFPFRVATEQQVANYVAAASFIPDEAPNIELFSEIWPSNKSKHSQESS